MKKNKISVSIIGAGNVANILGRSLVKKHVKIHQIYSSTFSASKKLASLLGAKAVKDITELDDKTDLILIAVKDDAIPEIASKIKKLNTVIAHTSGTFSLVEIKNNNGNYGVFYPLQTLSKNRKADFKKIPILIEGSNKKTEKKLTEIARLLSQEVHLIDSVQRSKIHLTAVLVSNFTNHIYALAEEFIKNEKGLDFKLLLPLIQQVTENLKSSSPSKNQTGPAIRGDKKTMQRHLKMLEKKKDLKEIYALISKSIHQFHNEKRRKGKIHSQNAG